jgi:hypothetical protein
MRTWLQFVRLVRLIMRTCSRVEHESGRLMGGKNYLKPHTSGSEDNFSKIAENDGL